MSSCSYAVPVDRCCDRHTVVSTPDPDGPPRRWTAERIVDASDAIDEQQLVSAGPDTLQVRTDDYVLLRYPDRLRSPTMGLVQAWPYARRPLATFIDEAEGRARSWGEDEIRWWVADNGLVGTSSFCWPGAASCAIPITYWPGSSMRSDRHRRPRRWSPTELPTTSW